MTEDEMVGWHHWLDGHESGWTLGVGDGQGGLVCCDPWGLKQLDTTERLNWTECHTQCPCLVFPRMDLLGILLRLLINWAAFFPSPLPLNMVLPYVTHKGKWHFYPDKCSNQKYGHFTKFSISSFASFHHQILLFLAPRIFTQPSTLWAALL